MRTLIAALTIALLPVAASAQSDPSLTSSRDLRSGYHSHKEIKPRYQKDIDDGFYRMKDRTYENALKSIPDSKLEFDPWKNAR